MLTTFAVNSVLASRAEKSSSDYVRTRIDSVANSIRAQIDSEFEFLTALADSTTSVPFDPTVILALPPSTPELTLFPEVTLIDVDMNVAHRFSVDGAKREAASTGLSVGEIVTGDLTRLDLGALPVTGQPRTIRLLSAETKKASVGAPPTGSSVAVGGSVVLIAPIPSLGWLTSTIDQEAVESLFTGLPGHATLEIALHAGASTSAPKVAVHRATDAPEPENVRWTSTSFGVADQRFTLVVGHDRAYGAGTPPRRSTVLLTGVLLTLGLAGLIHIGSNRRSRRSLESQLADARRIARTDELTGLGNRLAISETLQAAGEEFVRSGRDVAVILCDLDRFKIVNDARGHDAGDVLLCDVAKRLQGLDDSATVARFGGDEFVVILSGDATERARQIAARVVEVIKRPFTIGHDAVVIGASVGLASTRDGRVRQAGAEPFSASRLLSDADAAMYIAKRAGGNRVAVADEIPLGETRQLDMEIALRAALGTGQIRAFFQPIVDRERNITALEALVRWQHPEKGLISPGAFLPAAKSAGLLAELSTVVLAQSCFQVALWNEARTAQSLLPLLVHVNCVEEQLTDPGFADVIEAYVLASGIDPGCLLLEISEETAFEKLPATLPTLDLVRALGVHFSLDDFGFGNSSLTMVRRLGAVSEIKIDKSIVDSLAPDAPAGNDRVADIAVIRAISDFARVQGIALVAEGIEHETQFEQLRSFGVSLFQGFLFHRPQDPAVLAALLVPPAPIVVESVRDGDHVVTV